MAGLYDKFVVQWLFQGDTKFLSNVNKQVTDTNARLNQMQKRFDNAALRIGVIGTVAAAVLGVMGKAGIDADFQFRRTQARLQATNEEMDILRHQAEALAAELPLNLLDIAKAQEEYGARGNPIENILRDLPAISRAKVAVSADLAELAKHAHVFSTIFGVSVEEALDKMVAIENSSAATAVTMGRALQFSAQTAKEMGVTADEYLALLGGLAGAGVDVSRSSRGLTNFLSRIAKGITDLGEGGPITVEALAAIGISLEELTAIMSSGEGAFLRFLRRLKNVDAGFLAETATALTLGGVSYGSAFQALVENLDDVIKNIEVSAKSTGTVIGQVDTILGGSYGSVQRTMAQLDLLRHTMAESGATNFIAWLAEGARHMVQFGMSMNELTRGGLFIFINILLAAGASLLAFAAIFKIASFTIGVYKAIFLGLMFLKARFGRQTTADTAVTTANTAATTASTAATQRQTMALNAGRGPLALGTAEMNRAAVGAAFYTKSQGLMTGAVLRAVPPMQAYNTMLARQQLMESRATAITMTHSNVLNSLTNAYRINGAIALQAGQATSRAQYQNITALELHRAALRRWQASLYGSSVAVVGNTAAITTNTVARSGAAAATGLWAKAQWGLNIAMRANPLGALISGALLLIPLIGLLVTFWSEIWGFVRKVGSTVGGWIGLGGGEQDSASAPRRPRGGDLTGLLHTLGQPLPVAPAQAVPGYPGASQASSVVEGDTTVTFQPGAVQISPTGEVDAQAIAADLMQAVNEEARTRRRAAVDAAATRVAR